MLSNPLLPSMRPSGASDRVRALLRLAPVLLLALGGCLYGFHGGGLPGHVRTFAVIPFENQTPVTDLQRELADSLRARLASSLGIRPASEARANAIVRGVIRRYEADIPVGVQANTRAATNVQRQLQMVVDIDVVDQVTGKSLWSRKNYMVDGDYPETQEAVGRARALDKLVRAIVEGVQSQW
jgi:hypothetical protein